jgi:hypothetical protein
MIALMLGKMSRDNNGVSVQSQRAKAENKTIITVHSDLK